MRFEVSEELDQKLRKLRLTNLRLSKKIEKQLSLFLKNPRHPSLRIHRLTGHLKKFWSLSVSKGIRMIYILENDVVYFTDIGTHDEVYKK